MGEARFRKNTSAWRVSKVTGESVEPPYYRAAECCDMMHYTSASVLVAVLELVVLVALGARLLYVHLVTEAPLTVFDMSLSGRLIAIVFLLAAVYFERPQLLWPHMLCQLLVITMGGVATLTAVLSMALGTNNANVIFGAVLGEENLVIVSKSLGPVWPFCLAVIFDFAAALAIWSFVVVKGAHDYYVDKRAATNGQRGKSGSDDRDSIEMSASSSSGDSALATNAKPIKRVSKY